MNNIATTSTTPISPGAIGISATIPSITAGSTTTTTPQPQSTAQATTPPNTQSSTDVLGGSVGFDNQILAPASTSTTNSGGAVPTTATVSPALNVTPYSNGAAETVSGTGYIPNSTVTLNISAPGQGVVNAIPVTTNATGGFSIGTPAGYTQAAGYTVTATQGDAYSTGTYVQPASAVPAPVPINLPTLTPQQATAVIAQNSGNSNFGNYGNSSQYNGPGLYTDGSGNIYNITSPSQYTQVVPTGTVPAQYASASANQPVYAQPTTPPPQPTVVGPTYIVTTTNQAFTNGTPDAPVGSIYAQLSNGQYLVQTPSGSQTTTNFNPATSEETTTAYDTSQILNQQTALANSIAAAAPKPVLTPSEQLALNASLNAAISSLSGTYNPPPVSNPNTTYTISPAGQPAAPLLASSTAPNIGISGLNIASPTQFQGTQSTATNNQLLTQNTIQPSELQNLATALNTDVNTLTNYIVNTGLTFNGPLSDIANAFGVQNPAVVGVATGLASLPLLPESIYNAYTDPTGTLSDIGQEVTTNPLGFVGQTLGPTLGLGTLGSMVGTYPQLGTTALFDSEEAAAAFEAQNPGATVSPTANQQYPYAVTTPTKSAGTLMGSGSVEGTGSGISDSTGFTEETPKISEPITTPDNLSPLEQNIYKALVEQGFIDKEGGLIPQTPTPPTGGSSIGNSEESFVQVDNGDGTVSLQKVVTVQPPIEEQATVESEEAEPGQSTQQQTQVSDQAQLGPASASRYSFVPQPKQTLRYEPEQYSYLIPPGQTTAPTTQQIIAQTTRTTAPQSTILSGPTTQNLSRVSQGQNTVLPTVISTTPQTQLTLPKIVQVQPQITTPVQTNAQVVTPIQVQPQITTPVQVQPTVQLTVPQQIEVEEQKLKEEPDIPIVYDDSPRIALSKISSEQLPQFTGYYQPDLEANLGFGGSTADLGTGSLLGIGYRPSQITTTQAASLAKQGVQTPQQFLLNRRRALVEG